MLRKKGLKLSKPAGPHGKQPSYTAHANHLRGGSSSGLKKRAGRWSRREMPRPLPFCHHGAVPCQRPKLRNVESEREDSLKTGLTTECWTSGMTSGWASWTAVIMHCSREMAQRIGGSVDAEVHSPKHCRRHCLPFDPRGSIEVKQYS